MGHIDTNKLVFRSLIQTWVDL